MFLGEIWFSDNLNDEFHISNKGFRVYDVMIDNCMYKRLWLYKKSLPVAKLIKDLILFYESDVLRRPVGFNLLYLTLSPLFISTINSVLT